MNILAKIISRIYLGFLFNKSPEKSHDVALNQLDKLHKLRLLNFLGINKKYFSPVSCMGIDFPNMLGLAAGLDKNGDYIDALSSLGFGYIEIGTVTPKPQLGNQKPRLFRLKKDKAIINRMGFNNKGVDYLIKQVEKSSYKGILGINIGKNADTPIESAVDDYLICLRKVYDYSSYVTINISSPNTKNLRDLQSEESLNNLLSCLIKERIILQKKYNKYVPLVVKISPDINKTQINTLAKVFLKNKIDAVIATNTSVSRPSDLKHTEISSEIGGLSGAPIKDISTDVIKILSKQLKSKIPIIGCGGISCGSDAKEKILAGATLLQVYTSFIYKGPNVISDILKNIEN
tara:strand:+ start:3214 stop:4254 length:1041 start_codon:yes stop_codon:yes gene_type:complete